MYPTDSTTQASTASATCRDQARLNLTASRFSWLLMAILAVACSGCGDGLYQVKGVVLVDGTPAPEGVRVLFMPQGNMRQGDATVGANGTFVMQTFGKKGVMPGEYKVTLINSTKSIPRPDTPVDTSTGAHPPADVFKYMAEVQKLLDNPPVGPGWIPKLYADMARTPLRVNVPKDGSNVKFEVPSNSGDDKGDKKAGEASK
jgi:hypothetical protein